MHFTKKHKQMKRYHYIQAVTYLLAAIAFVSCGKKSEKQSETTTTKNNVRVLEVQTQDVQQLETFTATVEAENVNNIAPGVPARIRRIYVDVGSTVRKGQTLVQMDGTNLAQQKTQLESLKRDYQRYKELYEVGGISQQQLEQMKAQLDVASSSYANLSENTVLTSPINGVVTARNYDAGDMPAGLPILTVQNIQTVKVLIKVSESFYPKVTKGMPVDVRVDVFGDELFQGKVSLIYPTLDAISHTFPVEIELQNKEWRIRPGMFARVTMNFGSNHRPLIPDVAVLKQAGTDDRYVFVAKEGKAVFTPVKTGRRINDTYEIISGLAGGELIVVQGNSNLNDGDEIEIIP